MLSALEIADALEATNETERLTVVPWPERADLLRAGETSIDLRLGRWFRSFKQTRTPSVSLVGRRRGEPVDPSEMSRTKQHFVPFGSNYVLHPGRFVLGVTLEWLRLPPALAGYVAGKSSLGRHGLVIETAAGIHPQFSGCLTLELANVGEVPLEIYPGMPICQIFLHRTSPGEERERDRFSGRRKPMLSPPTADAIFERLVDVRQEPSENSGT
ncbi:MAG TPA: dCTP deaminase [Sphingomicrobium sp.]|nr:dCTP deaminase [Sphingomicrobium sp.]